MNSQKPGNSQEFLENPRNCNLFSDMQINKIEKPWNFWEYLGISENTYGNFWEFLGIPRNSNFEGELSLEFVGIIIWEPKKVLELFIGIPRNSRKLKSIWLNYEFKFNSHKDYFQ